MPMPTADTSPIFRAGSLWGAAVLSALALAGCSDVATDMGLGTKGPATIEAKVERTDPVTKTGRAAAVLSLHMRKSYTDACKLGLTLTNNLPFKVTNITYRITAMVDGNVPFDTQNKNFYELRPGEGQYRELTFQQVKCERIQRLEVADPGRCTLADLNQFNSNAGDCRKYTDLAQGRLVPMEWSKR
jgi:hypothetical protein